MSAKTSKPDSSATSAPNPRAFDKLYWLRIGFAVLAGVAAQYGFGTDYIDGMMVGLIFYLGSYYVSRYTWYRSLDRQSTGKLYSTAIGGYVFLFLFTWILTFTVASA